MSRNCGMGKDMLRALKEAAMSRDEERLQFRTQQFTEHIGGNGKHDLMLAQLAPFVRVNGPISTT